MLVLGVLFMVVIGRRLLPNRSSPSGEPPASKETSVSVEELASSYGLPGNLFRLRVLESSPLIGKSVAESKAASNYQLTVLEMSEPEDDSLAAAPKSVFDPHEIVLVYGIPDRVRRFAADHDLEILPAEVAKQVPLGDATGMAEVLLTPRSSLAGQTLAQSRFRDLYDLSVMSVLRMGKPLTTPLATTPLRFVNTLLVQGGWDRIRSLDQHRRDFVVVGQPAKPAQAESKLTWRAYASVGIMLAMLVFMTAGWLPTVTTILVAAVLMILTGCLPIQ